ncbi:MAG: sigma-70 family RNA polymerase sigma factor [Bryobacteraceae bacterium]
MTTTTRINNTEPASPRMAAFEAEAMPHHQDLFRTAMRMLQNQDKASDAVQEAYQLAWKLFDKYEAGTNCRAWLSQILFNVVRHERRNWFKWITGKEEDLSQTELAAPPEVPDTLTDSAILAALDRMPEQFRAVVLLTDVEEFSYKEASQILNIPIGTVMSRLSRGRAQLREELRDVAQSYGVLCTRAAEA